MSSKLPIDHGVVAASIFPTDWDWQPPSSYQKITTIDTHTGGEPLRIPVSGLPPIHGNTVLEKRRYFMKHYDHLRSGLLLEPRGHADMYGAILTTSKDPKADLDCFFINTDGYSPMCGHAILAITKVAFETGVVKKDGVERDLTIAVPAGLVIAKALVAKDGTVTKTTFRNVPSFVYLLDQQVNVPGVGEVTFDVAFGGAFYAVVDAVSLELFLNPESHSKLIEYGRKVKSAILSMPHLTITHPFEDDLSSLFGVIFTGPPHNTANHSRNVTVFEDGEVDRSSTGTGVSARAALHFAKGELKLGEEITVESIVGSVMSVKAAEEVKFGDYDAVVPEVSGEAHITGRHELYFQKDDTFKEGFRLR
jgi:trans-L-3-hydroxyproline dehydratase